jgi:hypothetical protein
VIAIGNLAGRLTGPEPQTLFLRCLPNEVVEKVLEANFPSEPDANRRLAVALSCGFLRIAIDICKHGWTSGTSGAKVETGKYYRNRLSESDRKIVEALALVTRVGWMQDVAKEWTDLCTLCQLGAPDDARQRARALKEAPGFVGIGGRYFYVTPEAIAEIALEQAFGRWIEPDPKAFFDRVPPSLEEAFLSRVARCSNHEVRDAVAQYASHWVACLSPEDLPDKKKTQRLTRLAEIEPESYLPVVRRLVEGARPETLQAVSGTADGDWGPRRRLIWLCEQAASFPQFFSDAELTLFRLAVHENETGIANNATGLWRQLFRLFLPGTSVPYLERLEVLRTRLKSENREEALLALSALGEIFEDHFSRTVGPPLFAGAVPPEDWRPSNVEARTCIQAAFETIEDVLKHPREALQVAALDLVCRHLPFLLRHGHLSWARRFLDGRVGVRRLPQVIETIEAFASFGARPKGQPALSTEDVSALRAWRDSLVPPDVHAQLVRDVGRYVFRQLDGGGERELQERLGRLAVRFVADPKQLDAELPWLVSKDAKSSSVFGEVLGELDAEAALFLPIVNASRDGTDGLVCGYVRRLLIRQPRHARLVNGQLDQLEQSFPLLAFNISLSAPEQTAAYERALRLFDTGRLPVAALGNLRHALGDEGLSEKRLEELLARILSGGDEPSDDALRTALRLCSSWMRGTFEMGKKPRVSSGLKRSFRRVVRARSGGESLEQHDWNRLLRVYAQLDLQEAIQIACEGLEDLRDDYERWVFVQEAAEREPRAVLEALGNALLDERRGWKLRIGGVEGILSAIPVSEVHRWLNEHGVAGARALARSLPRPFVDGEGVPRVPCLTEAVLKRFGDDEETRAEFECGGGCRSYSGDRAGQREAEARVASAFLGHPMAAIREWALLEKASAEHDAKLWQNEDAERLVPR